MAEDNIIAGNVILYGATAGEMFLRGLVGERFASATAAPSRWSKVVGDHACEYMTGGRVVVLGTTGRNFGAGHVGRRSPIVHDPDGTFPSRVNPEMVDLEELDDDDVAWLSDRVERHRAETGSTVAARLLDDWDGSVGSFVKVMPKDYKRVLLAERDARAEGRDPVEAVMAAARV